MNHSELIAKPCPFCGKAADLTNDDTLYPSGIWWRECDGLRSYHGHKDRCEDDFQCWGMHCAETAGGCGASVSGDSVTDALEKWNKRPDALQALERVPMTESGWLIECNIASGAPFWLKPDGEGTNDSNEALRFSRVTDAQGFLDSFLVAKYGKDTMGIFKRHYSKEKYSVTEHMWLGSKSDKGSQ